MQNWILNAVAVASVAAVGSSSMLFGVGFLRSPFQYFGGDTQSNKVSAAGSLDPSFGTGGKVTTDLALDGVRVRLGRKLPELAVSSTKSARFLMRVWLSEVVSAKRSSA